MGMIRDDLFLGAVDLFDQSPVNAATEWASFDDRPIPDLSLHGHSASSDSFRSRRAHCGVTGQPAGHVGPVGCTVSAHVRRTLLYQPLGQQNAVRRLSRGGSPLLVRGQRG